MTVFSATASRDLVIIVVGSLIAAVVVNIPSIVALARLWVES